MSNSPIETKTVADASDDLKRALRPLGGSRSHDWNCVLIDRALESCWLKHSDAKTREQQLGAVGAALAGIGPEDELEGMLAVQLLASHNAAMECYRRAMLAEQTFEARQENLNLANKCSRTFAALVEALDRHRGKGQQKVTVEHVHIYPGGQAIVGAVNSGGEGGGNDKFEGQPDAPRSRDEPGASMRSAYPAGKPMSLARRRRKTPL